jgi:hypothetical protein
MNYSLFWKIFEYWVVFYISDHSYSFQPGWNKKTAMKLVELVNHGWTTVREKGKINRLRMPICKVSSSKALGEEKRLAGESEADPNGPVSPPTVLTVQLEPSSESAYCRVHRLAQNPFLSVEVAAAQTLKFLIQFLENKWKSRRNQFVRFMDYYLLLFFCSNCVFSWIKAHWINGKNEY